MKYRVFEQGKELDYLVTPDGKFYSRDEFGKINELKICITPNNLPYVSINIDGRRKSVFCKSMVAKSFMDDHIDCDRIIQIDGDVRNVAVSNLRNLSAEKRKAPAIIKDRKRNDYTTDNISMMLNISTSTVQEIKYKLKLNRDLKEDDFLRISKLVNDIRHIYKKVTLSTINDYIRMHGGLE